jgi:hypothetical protein
VSLAADLVLADAHVHLHPCFDLGAFLDAAHANLRAEAVRRGANGFRGMLLLVEPRARDGLGRLADPARRQGGAWRLDETEERESLRAHAGGGRELFVVAGHQLPTREGLEVLALGLRERPPERLELREQVEAVRARGGIAVLPWGAGKWLGRRGAALRALLAGCEEPQAVFLGDNAGRLGALPRPAPFADAERRGLRVLPGSDPLPFARSEGRVGRMGFALPVALLPSRPAAGLREALARGVCRPEGFGELESLPRFLRDQLATQVYKRLVR